MKTATLRIPPALMFLLLAGTAPAWPQNIPTLARRSVKAIVLIVASDKAGKEVRQGSGFFVSSDGKVATNYHVIAGADSAVVKFPSGAFYLVQGVLAADQEKDIAVLKVSGQGFSFLSLGNSDELQVGQEVVAIGSPLALEATVSNGIVSSIRKIEHGNLKVIQTSAPISPGSSGGALLNLRGEVVGITTFQATEGQNLNFAIPINYVKPLLTGGRVSPLGQLRQAAERQSTENLPAVCSFMRNKMKEAVPQVPTWCTVSGPLSVSVFSPTDVLESKWRRAWSSALFQAAEEAAVKRISNPFFVVFSDQELSKYNETFQILAHELNPQDSPRLFSEDWYKMHWYRAEHQSRVPWSGPQEAKQWIEYRGRQACGDFIEAVKRDPLRRITPDWMPVPDCSVLLVTHTKIAIEVRFPNYFVQDLLNYNALLLSVFGEAFLHAPVEGDIIFKSPWLATKEGEERNYVRYEIKRLRFLKEEADSGERVAFVPGAAGQITKNKHLPSEGLIYSIESLSTGSTLIFLTDGSVWSAPANEVNKQTCGVGSRVGVIPPIGAKTYLTFLDSECKNIIDGLEFVRAW